MNTEKIGTRMTRIKDSEPQIDTEKYENTDKKRIGTRIERMKRMNTDKKIVFRKFGVYPCSSV